MKSPTFVKALEFAVRGYSIIPLRRNKLPLLGSWKEYQKKPADETQIEKWFAENPNANIGIVTGKISGLTVVDIDTKGGHAVDLDTFPRTFTVKTPTGGYHLYYEYCEEIQQTANTFPQFPHVDIRNDGGYVVAPPSLCDYVKDKTRVKGSYKIERNFPIVPFPINLFKQRIQKKPVALGKLLVGFNVMEDGDGRNNALTKIIGKILKLVHKSDWEAVAFPLALATNLRFKKPLDEKEVRTIFDSLVKRESQKPHQRLNVELISTEKGEPIINERNVHKICTADNKLSACMRFNTFTGLVEINFERDEFKSYQRDDVLRVRMYLMDEYPFLARVPHQMVEDVLVRLAHENPVSPPKQWLESLRWDNVDRLSNWLHHTYGVPNDDYHQKVGSNVLKGLVSRLIYPGCKFDYVLVIEGPQGIRKSTSLKVLGGDWHVETTLTPDNKDFFLLFSGKAIVELAEGETLSRTEAKRLKAVITIQSDKYRVPYDRSPQEFPRQCIFMMTTNEDEYLKDETGNRRWLPISVSQSIDIDWLAKNREQLYAEAYHRVVSLKETTYEFPEEETRAQQEKRQIRDPRADAVYAWYFSVLTKEQREQGVTTQEAFIQGVQKGQPFMKEMSKIDSMIIGSILRSHLKLDKRQSMNGGMRAWRYYPTAESAALAPMSFDGEMETNIVYRDAK